MTDSKSTNPTPPLDSVPCDDLLADGVPFFKTEAEYEAFRQGYIESVRPEMERHARAMAESARESKTRWVNSANDKLTCGERSEPLGAASGSPSNG